MFFKKFKMLCLDNNVSANKVAKELGLSNAVVTNWKNGAIPRDTTLKLIADYFGVETSYFFEEEEKIESNAVILDNKKIHLVPVFESVSAGFGTMAVDEIIDYFPFMIESETEAKESICIVVRGDSMAPKIDDGDLILVHKQTSVDSGSTAVLLLDGEEALVKKVYYGKDWIELHSANPIYGVRRFVGKDVLRLQVLGLVRAVQKRM